MYDFSRYSVPEVILTVFVFALHFFAEPVRWMFFLRGHRKLVLLHIFNVTAMVSYLLPFKLGLPTRIALMRKFLSVDFASISLFMAFDALVYYGLWMLCALAGLAYLGSSLSFQVDVAKYWWFGVVVLVAAFLFVRMHFFRRFRSKALSAFYAVRQRSSQITPRLTYTAGAIVICDIVTHVARHFVILDLCGQTVAVVVLAAITVVSVAAGLFSMMPMGLGGYDAVIVALLMTAGVKWEVAIAVPIMNRFFSLLVSCLLGGVAAWSLRFNPFSKADQAGFS